MGLDTSKATVLQALGPYDLLEKIAEGGMGAIYRGRNRQTGEVVAIKLMSAKTAANPGLLQRFEQEFRAASKLDHPNVVRAIDYGNSGGAPYLVMEFVEGESLGQRIERDGKLAEAEAIKLIADVAQGLHRAHKQGLIHRDVKPDNILVTPKGLAKLADLGLVKESESDLNLTKTGRGLGTPHFMSPEQFRNAKNADVRCDIYSLGATLYQMVTGELPFRSTGPLDAWMKKIQNDLVPPRKIVPGLSERVEWAILRAMSADPQRRPASCREFIEDLTGRSTRRPSTSDSGAPLKEIWYLIYRDENGMTHTVKGATPAVRRSLKDGHLGDASGVRASRSKAGPFEALASYPEFRDLVVSAAPLPTPTTGNRSVSAGTNAEASRPVSPIPTPPSEARVPHITLGGGGPPRPTDGIGHAELLKWGFFFLVLFASAAIAFWLF